MNTYPTLAEFLAWPSQEVAKVMPKSVMQSATLTRRGAVLAGAADSGEAYSRWGLENWIRCTDLLFEHGVQHLFVVHLHPSNFQENTPNYREHLARWVNVGMLSETARRWYEQRQYRVKVLYYEALPEFMNLHLELARLTAHHTGPTIWNMYLTDGDLPNRWLLKKLQGHTLETSAETIQLLYGEAVPPIELYLGFGKPVMSPLPPFLLGKMNCYWGQFCGFCLTPQILREIVYDHVYTRATWQADKQDRAKEVLKNRAAWDPGPVVGLGTRLGSFWYPQPLAATTE